MNWTFRDLGTSETRILFMRHGAHKANVLTPEAVPMCIAVGKALADTGIEIDSAASSPAGRALETVLTTLQGYGKMVYIRTDDKLADTAINEAGRTAVKKIKAIMKTRKVSGEEEMAKILFDPDGEFTDLMRYRGEEGANCLYEIIKYNLGKTILIGSHGIARVENTLMALRGETIHQPKKLVATCQIIEIIFDYSEFKIVEENWLDPVVV